MIFTKKKGENTMFTKTFVKRIMTSILTICIVIVCAGSFGIRSEAAKSFKDTLNNAALTPVVTGYADADQKIAEVIGSITGLSIPEYVNNIAILRLFRFSKT